MAHRCNPDRCHRCPDLNGAVMPGCMGTAALALHENDMSYCTCRAKRLQPEDVEELRKEVQTLKGKLLVFEKKFDAANASKRKLSPQEHP